jgi:hypothetical protein
VCARIIPHQPAEVRSPLKKRSQDNSADLNSSSASYRVLGSGRQRPRLSVNRETAGRNASESTEPRQISRVWVPSLYGHGEGNTQSQYGKRPTGVQENSMLSRLMKREPRRSRVSQVGTESEVFTQGFISKKTHTPTLDVRWFHSSKEIG